ncbi:MAG: hypothetical protein JNN11_01510 [Candidatus Doudnabacteria bacterium]|nr:hypothetical protein [Candidatus Doudnabacteria bacterium]
MDPSPSTDPLGGPMFSVLCGLLAALLSLAPLSASVLNLSNIAGGSITAGGGTVNFLPIAPAANCSVGGGNTGLFAAATGNCTMVDFTNSTMVSQAGFLGLANMPGVVLDLSSADAAVGPALGATVSLVQLTPNLVSAFITLHGSGMAATTAIAFDVVLSTQATGTVAGVQQNGIGPTSWSATLMTTSERPLDTPEPATFFLVGAMLVAAGLAKAKGGVV